MWCFCWHHFLGTTSSFLSEPLSFVCRYDVPSLSFPGCIVRASGTANSCRFNIPRASFFFFFFWLCHTIYGIPDPRSGIELMPPTLEALNLNCWTSREVLASYLKNHSIYLQFRLHFKSYHSAFLCCASTVCCPSPSFWVAISYSFAYTFL